MIPTSPERFATVHPRACGERSATRRISPIAAGSSPRVRGTQSRGCSNDASSRFIPARAGNAFRHARNTRFKSVHPRACGERAIRLLILEDISGSSPRVRGTPPPHVPEAMEGRFIPARAGNARPLKLTSGWSVVHPRACGERRVTGAFAAATIGSSPRVRGTLAR